MSTASERDDARAQPDAEPIAYVGPTGYGTFGVRYRNWPSMQRRGGYSGPDRTIEAAEDTARSWAATLDVPNLVLERVANVNAPEFLDT